MKAKNSTIIIFALMVVLGAVIFFFDFREPDEFKVANFTGLLLSTCEHSKKCGYQTSVENWDAYFLLDVFPGLEPSDFQFVDGADGQYQLNDNQELEFPNNGGGAGLVESRLTDNGYRTLLLNLTKRLGVENVETIIEKISEIKQPLSLETMGVIPDIYSSNKVSLYPRSKNTEPIIFYPVVNYEISNSIKERSQLGGISWLLDPRAVVKNYAYIFGVTASAQYNPASEIIFGDSSGLYHTSVKVVDGNYNFIFHLMADSTKDNQPNIWEINRIEVQ